MVVLAQSAARVLGRRHKMTMRYAHFVHLEDAVKLNLLATSGDNGGVNMATLANAGK